MRTDVEFRSRKFPPLPDGADEVNPGHFGRRLADHVSARLAGRGLPTRAVYAEDWGWVVELENADFPLWVGCGNTEEGEDHFLCTVQPSAPSIRRGFRSVDTRPAVTRVVAALEAVLGADPEITDVQWREP